MPKIYGFFHVAENIVVNNLGSFTSKTRWKNWWKTHYVSYNAELKLYWRCSNIGRYAHPEYYKLRREEFEPFEYDITTEEMTAYKETLSSIKEENRQLDSLWKVL